MGAEALGSARSRAVAEAIDRGPWLRVVAFAELDDGRRVTDGQHGHRTVALGRRLSEHSERSARTLRDVADASRPQARSDWSPLRAALAAAEVAVDEDDLARMPFEAELDPQLRASLRP